MLQITRVDTLDDFTLDIELNNGHLILFSMKPLLEREPSLSLNEIFTLLHRQENNN